MRPAESCGCPPLLPRARDLPGARRTRHGGLVMDQPTPSPSSPPSAPPTSTCSWPPARAPARPAPSSAASSTSSVCRSRASGSREPLTLRDISAITYTNAAAADLKRKLREELRKAGRRDEAYEIDGARIGTIHGFCGAILREFALRTGRNPGAAGAGGRRGLGARRRGSPEALLMALEQQQRAGARRALCPVRGHEGQGVDQARSLATRPGCGASPSGETPSTRRPAPWWTSR